MGFWTLIIFNKCIFFIKSIMIQSMALSSTTELLSLLVAYLMFLGLVWEYIFKEIICVFKPNHNFEMFEITILKI
jgi:hypothetical protein